MILQLVCLTIHIAYYDLIESITMEGNLDSNPDIKIDSYLHNIYIQP